RAQPGARDSVAAPVRRGGALAAQPCRRAARGAGGRGFRRPGRRSPPGHRRQQGRPDRPGPGRRAVARGRPRPPHGAARPRDRDPARPGADRGAAPAAAAPAGRRRSRLILSSGSRVSRGGPDIPPPDCRHRASCVGGVGAIRGRPPPGARCPEPEHGHRAMSRGALPDSDETVPIVNDLAAAIIGAPEVAVFESLYAAHAGEARRLAAAILGDSELAADAVHAGFLEMLRYIVSGKRWHDADAARSVVMRNVRWAALKSHRSRKGVSLGLDRPTADASSDVQWAQAEARELAEQIVARLSPLHRVAIRMRYVDGLSNVESARLLEIHVDAFESRVRQALRAARRVARANG